MLKRLIALGGLAVLAMAAPAAAQQYPPAVNSLTCSDTTPTPGQTITIEGRTFAPGSTATVTLDSVALGSATANADGVIALQATIPADTPLGAHTFVATGQAPNGQTLTLSLVCQVVPAESAGAGTTGGPLPNTGSNSTLPLVQIGLGLLALGGVIYAVASRRRKAPGALSA